MYIKLKTIAITIYIISRLTCSGFSLSFFNTTIYSGRGEKRILDS